MSSINITRYYREKKYQKRNGLTSVVAHGESGLKKVMFDLLRLEADESYVGDTELKESAFVILSGTCSISGADFNFKHIGIRKDVFSGKPTSVYLPCKTSYKIDANTDLEIGICSAGSTRRSAPVLIGPDDATEVNLGVLNWRRKAYFIIGQNFNSEFLFIAAIT